jgi:hypothetical protein
VTATAPVLTASFWRSRRAAAVAGIIFGVLLLAAMIMMQLALSKPESLQHDAQRRNLVRLSIDLVPFAGIAFLWFIGVVREQLGAVEDRLFATVFFGSGLIFLASMFVACALVSGLIGTLAVEHADVEVWAFGRQTSQELISVYAMRMAAVFTLSVSTVGRRTSSIPRWICYTGYLVALVLLLSTTEQKWSQLLFPGWVLLVSGAILFTSPPERDVGTDPSRGDGEAVA